MAKNNESCIFKLRREGVISVITKTTKANMPTEIIDCIRYVYVDSVSTPDMPCFNMEKVPGWKVTKSKPELKYSCCMA